jgi:hypothetical protein
LVLLGCLVLEVAFVLLDYHVNFSRLTNIGALRRLTNIAREDGAASWFATMQTLLVGLTAWVILAIVHGQRAPRWRRAGWLTVAVLFTYMAVDDGAQIHERLATAVDARGGPDFFPSYTWQVLLVPVFGVVGVATVVFLWRELRDGWAVALVAAGFFLFGVAVGLDFLEGLDEDHAWNVYAGLASRYDLASFTKSRFGQAPYATLQHFSRSLEEFVEMLANTLIWTALLRHIASVTDSIRIRVSA